MLNTPPTFAWYMAGLVFKWVKKNGGVAAMGERNRVKSEKLYAAIDGSPVLPHSVAKDSRSWMNVTFTLVKPELDVLFLECAAASRLEKPERPPCPRRHAGEPVQTPCRWPGLTRIGRLMREFERKHA